MPRARTLPPIWLMGSTNATFGLYGGFVAVSFPSMLAAQGLPGGRIAAITATIVSPSFFVFLFSPLLDVRLSRRTYALIFTAIAATAIAVTVTFRTHLALIQGVMFCGFLAASLVQGAVGGWMGSLISPEQDSTLGAWFGVAIIGAGGIMMLTAGQAVSRLSPALAGLLLAAMIAAPALIFTVVPAPGPDRKLARESYASFFREVLALGRLRAVQAALVLFLLPSASFSLTNVLGGTGPDFHAGERLVGLLAGVGSAAAGAVGSLLLPLLARRMALRPLYLAVGIAGALFTLSLLLLPRTPWSFALAISGENLFQALGIAVGIAIAFEIMGPGNPLAATLFSVLSASANFSITYMGFVDGRAYTWRGVTGAFLVDAGLSMTACLGLLCVWWARSSHRLRPGEALR